MVFRSPRVLIHAPAGLRGTRGLPRRRTFLVRPTTTIRSRHSTPHRRRRAVEPTRVRSPAPLAAVPRHPGSLHRRRQLAARRNDASLNDSRRLLTGLLCPAPRLPTPEGKCPQPERNDGLADPKTPAAVDRRRAGQGARAASHKRTRWRRSASAKSSIAASHVDRPRPCAAEEGASQAVLPATLGRPVTSVQPLAQQREGVPKAKTLRASVASIFPAVARAVHVDSRLGGRVPDPGAGPERFNGPGSAAPS